MTGPCVARVRFAMVFLGKINRHGGFKDAFDLKLWLEENYSALLELDALQDGPAVVLKRHTLHAESFDLKKLERSIGIAAKGRGTDARVRGIATDTARRAIDALSGQPIVTTQQIASEVLRLLRTIDDIAYLRYASVAKPFRSVEDFWHEVIALTRGRS